MHLWADFEASKYPVLGVFIKQRVHPLTSPHVHPSDPSAYVSLWQSIDRLKVTVTKTSTMTALKSRLDGHTGTYMDGLKQNRLDGTPMTSSTNNQFSKPLFCNLVNLLKYYGKKLTQL